MGYFRLIVSRLLRERSSPWCEQSEVKHRMKLRCLCAIPKCLMASMSAPAEGRYTRNRGCRKVVLLSFVVSTERKRAEEALAQAYSLGRLDVVDTILHNIGNAINSVTIGIGTVHGHLVRNKLLRRLLALADAVKANQEDMTNYIQNDPQGKQVAPFIIALAEDFAKQNEKLRKTVARVSDRVEHIADIVSMQKSLGRRIVDRTDINQREAIADAIMMLQESIKKREIEVHVDCENAPSEIPDSGEPISSDVGQFNLELN